MARIAAMPGVGMAVKCDTPIIPMLEMVKVGLAYSAGASLRMRARSTRPPQSPCSVARDFFSMPCRIGTTKPPSFEVTATPKSWLLRSTSLSIG